MKMPTAVVRHRRAAWKAGDVVSYPPGEGSHTSEDHLLLFTSGHSTSTTLTQTLPPTSLAAPTSLVPATYGKDGPKLVSMSSSSVSAPPSGNGERTKRFPILGPTRQDTEVYFSRLRSARLRLRTAMPRSTNRVVPAEYIPVRLSYVTDCTATATPTTSEATTAAGHKTHGDRTDREKDRAHKGLSPAPAKPVFDSYRSTATARTGSEERPGSNVGVSFSSSVVPNSFVPSFQHSNSNQPPARPSARQPLMSARCRESGGLRGGKRDWGSERDKQEVPVQYPSESARAGSFETNHGIETDQKKAGSALPVAPKTLQPSKYGFHRRSKSPTFQRLVDVVEKLQAPESEESGSKLCSVCHLWDVPGMEPSVYGNVDGCLDSDGDVDGRFRLPTVVSISETKDEFAGEKGTAEKGTERQQSCTHRLSPRASQSVSHNNHNRSLSHRHHRRHNKSSGQKRYGTRDTHRQRPPMPPNSRRRQHHSTDLDRPAAAREARNYTQHITENPRLGQVDDSDHDICLVSVEMPPKSATGWGTRKLNSGLHSATLPFDGPSARTGTGDNNNDDDDSDDNGDGFPVGSCLERFVSLPHHQPSQLHLFLPRFGPHNDTESDDNGNRVLPLAKHPALLDARYAQGQDAFQRLSLNRATPTLLSQHLHGVTDRNEVVRSEHHSPTTRRLKQHLQLAYQSRSYHQHNGSAERGERTSRRSGQTNRLNAPIRPAAKRDRTPSRRNAGNGNGGFSRDGSSFVFYEPDEPFIKGEKERERLEDLPTLVSLDRGGFQ